MIHVFYYKRGDTSRYLELWNVRLKEWYALSFSPEFIYHIAEGDYVDGRFVWGKVLYNFDGNRPILTEEEKHALEASNKVVEISTPRP